MNKIEIIPWVKFNDPGVKQEIEKLAEKSTSKMDFLSRVKDQYNLSLSEKSVFDISSTWQTPTVP